MAKRISVVVSQGQSNNPAKRNLEEDIVTALIMEPGIDVTLIPNLYDLKPDGTGMLALQGISGDMVMLSWMFPRAAHWILDRNGILGHVGETLLVPDDELDEDEADESEKDDDKERVVDQREIPNRKIYCLDLRIENKSEPYVEEIKRIAREASTQVVGLMNWVNGSPRPDQMQRFLQPTNDTAIGGNGNGSVPTASNGDHAVESTEKTPGEVTRVEDSGGRRWYPVIDFSRCTNCMECIDFCLFGVYGIDGTETILVEQPDNCRKGCPACSRVCPENAIIFPQHKTPAIAGSADVSAGLKIDLSQLFGAPTEGKSAEEMAVLERDEQLLLAGRDTVGATVGVAKRQEGKPDEPKDELDDLIDELDSLDI
jgi:NAD-dependent dihydropyrimidine dehydrogenase PreA subunit